MSEPNPYDPPQTPKPLAAMQSVKRQVGVAIILLLTPPAMVVTVLGTCAVAQKAAVGQSRMLIALATPLVVLTALMVWAMLLDRPRPGDPERRRSRTGIFLATPAVVAIAMVGGYIFAAVMILLPTTLPAYEWALENAAYFFWPLPAVALIAMMWIAWRGGRESQPVAPRQAPKSGPRKMPRLDNR